MSKIVGYSRVLSEYGEEYKVTVPYGHHTNEMMKYLILRT